MKGITPKFINDSKVELSTKNKSKFIELGVKSNCDKECSCLDKNKCENK